MTVITALKRSAIVNPHGFAIICDEQKRTWLEAIDRISRIATTLREAGLAPGGRVAILGSNSPDLLEYMMGVWWAGGVMVPLNTRLSLDELIVTLQHAQPRLFITDTQHAEAGRAASTTSGVELSFMQFDQGLDQSKTCVPSIANSNDLAAIFYTGGTTGIPKGVELTHANLVFMGLTIHRTLQHDQNTVYLHIPPLYHLADFSTALGVIYGAGAHSFMSHFRVPEFYDRLKEDGVSHLQLVPTMLEAILAAPPEQRVLLKKIRSVGYGAAPIGEPLLRRLMEEMPQARIYQFYGMTESAGTSTVLLPERHVVGGPLAGKLLSAGQPVPGTEIKIVDDTLNDVEVGKSGEILVRGPSVMRGYFRDPAKTSETIVDGWLRTGDIGRLDRDGFLFVHDRLKDMIISGGENIYCGEVENALLRHPGVQSCAVIGIPDKRWGEKVHATVLPKSGSILTEQDLDAHCRSLIAAYKVPRSYEIRNSPLPLSGVGKVNKKAIREEWLGNASSQEAPR